MDYVIGSIVTLFSIYFINRFIKKELDTVSITSITYSQSHIHNLISPFLPDNDEMVMLKPTQSSKYVEETQLRVLIVEDKAYWIKDNDFLVADLIEGLVDKESARLVDTMSMSKVELDKIMFIVEKLTGEIR